MSKGMTAGSLAIATGYVAATTLGQAQITVPCVIGRALFSGAGSSPAEPYLVPWPRK